MNKNQNGKKSIIQSYVMVGVKKMEKSIGHFKIGGEQIGVKMAISE